PSVGKGPGAIPFTRILCFAHSTASERVVAITPAFAAALGITKPLPVHAYVVRMLRIDPPLPLAIMRRPAASVALNEPCRTMPTTAAKPLGVRSSVGQRKLPAA